MIDTATQPPRATMSPESFQGARLISVERDHITRVAYVHMEKIRALESPER